MSSINIKFIGKDYTIPEDVLLYIDLLKITDSIKEQLVRDFVRLVSQSDSGLIDDDDMSSYINRQTNRFITMLCDNGIYDRTVNDYLKNNKGYQLFSDVNKSALNKIKSLLMQRLDAMQSGVESALYKKESSVTGMGFSIWSSSFVNHAIYAAMQASTINKQEKEASQEYQREVNALCSKLESNYDRDKSSFVKNEYVPNMEIAFTLFAYELLDKYISDLISNGKFDNYALSFVDANRSNDLLENLKLSDNKKAILENAFLACPYNAAVYMAAMRYDLLDIDTFQTAKTFKCDDTIITFLENSWGEVSYPKKFEINYHCIDLLALYTYKNSKDILHDYTQYYVNNVVESYSNVAKMCTNEDLCSKAVRKLSDNELLSGSAISSGLAQSHVYGIVSDSVWQQLIESCGHTDLFEKIKKYIPENVDVVTKKDIDDLYIKVLTNKFEKVRQKLAIIVNKRNEENKRRAEEETKQKEIEKQHRKRLIKLLLTIAPIIAISISMVACLFKFMIIPNNRYNNAVEMYNQKQYKDAIDIFQTMPKYKESSKYIANCYIFLDDYESAMDIYNSTDIILPNGITKIKANAFCNSKNLTSIVIPDSVTVIETKAFMECDSLSSITIPSSVTSIEEDAFYGCKNLKDVYINDLSKWCEIKFGGMSSNPLLYCKNLYINGKLTTKLIIPDDVTSIGAYAFTFCDPIVSVVMGNNVLTIGENAFSDCDNLKSVTLSQNIQAINDYVFYSCNSLSDIIIPNGVTTIGEMAFGVCEALSEIIIPNSVTMIADFAFANCDSLVNIVIPNGIKSINLETFDDCDSLKHITIPDSVVSIKESAFENCKQLTEIEFSGTIKSWCSIKKDEFWDYNTGNYTICCTDGEISASQNTLLECEVGDIITLGSYEQDGNSTNGTEAIEWIVLERNGNRALVISQYCIEQKPFNDTFSSVLWENCTLRKWLNSTFLNVAFSKEEQAKIISSNISTEGNNTTDKIFLLNEEEAVKYFDTDSDRKADATEYVSTSYCYWLLRTTGSVSNVAHVDYNGKVGYYENVDRNWWVRPAMWIEISN